MLLDPKIVQVHPAGHISREWQVRVPAGVAYADLFKPSTWAAITTFMSKRGGQKRPAPTDLIRIISANGSFDVLCLVTAVADGYSLRYYAGCRPSPVAEVLADLDALSDTASSADIKKQASTLTKRWRDSGVTREDLTASRRAFARQNHPDLGTQNSKLAAANSVIDHALANTPEAA